MQSPDGLAIIRIGAPPVPAFASRPRRNVQPSRRERVPRACAKCQGEGVLLSPLGSAAVAAECDCVQRCPLCHGARYLFSRDAAGREIARMCECERRRARIRLYNEAGVPAKFFGARLRDEQRDADNSSAFYAFALLAKDYARNSRGLVVMGPPGSGKTHLVAAFIYEIVFRHGVPVLFQDFFDLLKRLRSAYSREEPEEALIDPLIHVDVLVVDELGKGRNTPWEQTVLDMIISHRYNNRKTSIFTTNFTESRTTTLVERVRSKERPEEEREMRDTLRDRVGTRIHSRLKEMCDFIALDGPDRREWDGAAAG
jgi:DNA replication protein DnaC